MGNSPLTLCIQQIWEKRAVQVVQPDGQVLFMPRPMTVADLLGAHPSHFVCHASSPIYEQQLSLDTALEAGEIYYLLPIPGAQLSAKPQVKGHGLRHRASGVPSQEEKAGPVNSASQRASHWSCGDQTVSVISDYTQMNIKPQGCLIKLFVFRQSVASAVSPEETFKIPSNDACIVQAPPDRKFQRQGSRYRCGRGRRPVIAWRPHLESISENKPVNDFSKRNSFSSLSEGLLSSLANFRFTSLAPCSTTSDALAAIVEDSRESTPGRLVYSA